MIVPGVETIPIDRGLTILELFGLLVLSLIALAYGLGKKKPDLGWILGGIVGLGWIVWALISIR